MRGHGEATGCFISFDEGVRCACLRHHPSLLRQRDARRLRVALSSWRSLQVIARLSLSVTGAADCCAELFPLFQHHCAMSARDVWGFSIIRYFILGLSCVRAAYVHDVCVWFWRASRRSCQVGARCGHFGWRVLLTAALSCRPLHSFTAPFRSEMSGASALGTCVFSLARASAAVMRHVCVWPACELLRSFRSLHGGRFCVASAADQCA
jgi:hypothetical protein